MYVIELTNATSKKTFFFMLSSQDIIVRNTIKNNCLVTYQ